MKALLLLIGLTFSITIFAADPAPADSKMGETEGCSSSSNQALENCECVVDNAGSEAGLDGSGGDEDKGSGTATRGNL